MLYVPFLQVRQKWLKVYDNYQVGDLVLFKSDEEMRNEYQRAVVIQVFPDKFGIVRNVKVRLPDKREFERPINKLVHLEIPDRLSDEVTMMTEDEKKRMKSDEVTMLTEDEKKRKRSDEVMMMTEDEKESTRMQEDQHESGK